MTKMLRAVVALFVLCFAVTAVAEFPTSSIPATQDWKRINEDGFKGSFEDSCAIVGLTDAECEQFTKMHQGGACEDWDRIPQGSVFDSMAYTKDGQNTVMHGIRVALENPQHSSATVCQIGDKAVILPHYCNNLAVVNDWQPQVAYQQRGPNTVRDPYAGMASCPGGDPDRRYFRIAMYAPEAAVHACAIEHMLPYQGRLVEAGGPTEWGNMDAFSASCGKVFHEGERASELSIGSLRHGVEVVVIDGDNEWLIFRGTITGDDLDPAPNSPDDAAVMAEDGKTIFIPEEFQMGLVAVHFTDYTKVRTPARSGVAYPISEFRRGCRVMRYTGIEKPVKPEPTVAMVEEATVSE